MKTYRLKITLYILLIFTITLCIYFSVNYFSYTDTIKPLGSYDMEVYQTYLNKKDLKSLLSPNKLNKITSKVAYINIQTLNKYKNKNSFLYPNLQVFRWVKAQLQDALPTLTESKYKQIYSDNASLFKQLGEIGNETKELIAYLHYYGFIQNNLTRNYLYKPCHCQDFLNYILHIEELYIEYDKVQLPEDYLAAVKKQKPSNTLDTGANEKNIQEKNKKSLNETDLDEEQDTEKDKETVESEEVEHVEEDKNVNENETSSMKKLDTSESEINYNEILKASSSNDNNDN